METAEKCDLEREEMLFVNNGSLHANQTENEDVNKLFNKRFTIVKNKYYLLPEPSTMFKDCPWTESGLESSKFELNSAKNFLNNYDLNEWQVHTTLTNATKDVITHVKRNIQPELLTQAWCKFYEIVSAFPLIPVDRIRSSNNCFKSVHLCEAPGAFITSLNHWLKTNASDIQWDWIATTLNPYYEGNSISIMIDDDRFIRHTINHWCFGEDNTGNLMNVKNLNELTKLSKPHDDIFLVTADGSIDCTDVPAEQESVLIPLHFCETVAALQLLTTGGSFLLKIFTIFECNTVCLIYLLSCCFDNVSVVKPATSKEGNSETYVVCTNFKGPTFILPYLEKLKEHYEHGPKQAIFSKHDIPETFIHKIVHCTTFFNYHQCLVIRKNIDTFRENYSKMLYIKEIQHLIADKYIRDYNLKKLVTGEIVGNAVLLKKAINTTRYKRSLQGSYNDRCKKQHLEPLKRIESFYNDLNKIEISVSTGEVSKYNFTEFPEDLQIYLGKIFRKICNSKFCDKNAIKIQNGVDDILIKMNYKIQFPSIESIAKISTEINCNPNYKCLIFRYTDTYDTHRIISQICDALQNLTNGTTLVLIGYTLLTHLNMALLYLISRAFNLLTVTVCNDVGLKITLHHYNYNDTVLKFLNEIKTASTKAREEGKAIFGIISPLVLYEGCELCYSADFNHWVIKTYVQHVLCTLKLHNSSIE